MNRNLSLNQTTAMNSWKTFGSLILLCCFGCKKTITKKAESPQVKLEVIAFGSCNKQDEPQPLWKDITKENPSLWIWLGDNIYSDTEDMSVLAANYKEQNQLLPYSDFKKNVPIIGTWDDHDYGANDGDKSYPKKKESKELALDFYDVPKDAEVRKREGMYQSFEFTLSEKKVRIILLDTRYFRDKIIRKSSRKAYIPDPYAEMLGQAQWKWLEEELAKKEDVLIIGSGTQIIPEEHRFEKWSNFPTSRKRLFDLLDQETTDKIILLSGDRHIGEISKLTLKNKTIHEVTSSGLTHSYTKSKGEPNKHRIGELTKYLNYGLIKFHEDNKIELILCGENQKRHLSVFI